MTVFDLLIVTANFKSNVHKKTKLTIYVHKITITRKSISSIIFNPFILKIENICKILGDFDYFLSSFPHTTHKGLSERYSLKLGDWAKYI